MTDPMQVAAGEGTGEETCYLIAGMIDGMCQDVIVRMMDLQQYRPPDPHTGHLVAQLQLRNGDWVDIEVKARKESVLNGHTE